MKDLQVLTNQQVSNVRRGYGPVMVIDFVAPETTNTDAGISLYIEGRWELLNEGLPFLACDDPYDVMDRKMQILLGSSVLRIVSYTPKQLAMELDKDDQLTTLYVSKTKYGYIDITTKRPEDYER